MAMIDYGALLKVDGIFLNKDKELFADSSDTGYVCGRAFDEGGRPVVIDGNYFIYAGDEGTLLCFYKGQITAVCGDKVVKQIWATPFKSETWTDIPNIEVLTISHLDPSLLPLQRVPKAYEDWLEERYTISWCRHLYNNYKSKQFKKYLRYIVRTGREPQYWRTNRYIATWDYDGHHYEVIYGYGIDPSEETWERIKNDGYDFTDTEREIIDSWFYPA